MSIKEKITNEIIRTKIFSKFKSIKLEFAVPVLLLATLILIFFAIYKYVENSITTKQELKNKSIVMLELSNLVIADPLWNFNIDGTKQAVRAVLKDREVYYVKVKDNAGLIVYEESKKYLNRDLRGLIILKSKISKAGFDIGSIEIGITDYYRKKKLVNGLITNILTTFMIIFLLWLVIFGISDMVTKPINDLTTSTREISKGDFSKRIIIESQDEVAVLANNFNFMICSIEQFLNKEITLRKLVETIRSTLDINEIRKQLVTRIGSFFKADRTFIILYDPDTDKYISVDKYSEYLSGPDIKSLIGFDFGGKFAKYYMDINKAGKDVVFRDVEEYINENNLENTLATDFMRYYRVKSNVGFPIFYKDLYLGVFVLHFTKSYMDLNNEDLEFIRTVANQAAIALYQAKLYKAVKYKAARERLIKSVIETVRSSLDIDKTINTIINKIAKIFQVDSVVISQTIEKSKKNIVRGEFKRREDIKGIESLGKERFKIFEYFTKKIFPTDIVLSYDNIEESDAPEFIKEFYKKMDTKSIIVLPIKKKDDEWGVLSLSNIDKYKCWTEEEKSILKSIANQLYIAIKQAELYATTKDLAEREHLLREILMTIRSTLDINEIKRTFVNEIGLYFKADRVVFAEYDIDKKEFLHTDTEYLSDLNLQSFIEYDWSLSKAQLYIQWLKEQGEINITDLNTYLNEQDLENSDFARLFRDWKLKSSYSTLIMYGKDIMGFFRIDYLKEKFEIDNDGLEFLRTLANQAGIALHQSRLYNTVKQTAERETLLREVISEIKLSQSLDQAYNYILLKLGNVFNVDRTLFIESQTYKLEEINIKYEYRNKVDIPSLLNIKLPDHFSKLLLKSGNNYNPLIINNVFEGINNENEINFYKEYKVNSILVIPLIRYNRDRKVLGILVLCFSKSRIWTKDELNLLNAIIGSIINVIWEITKLLEIDKLRNTFILTLAHDFQIPLIAERKALEFIQSRPSDQPLSKYKEFIDETIESNESLVNLLVRILDIYNYESKKKVLYKIETDITILINDVVNSLQELAKSKSMNIDLNKIQENLPKVMIDKDEIKKVLFIILKNAVINTQKGGEITIKAYKEDNNLITCISDNGPGILPEIQVRLFERYEMALALERKIGGGLGLYFSKQIVEAHNGKIWLSSKLGEGSTFCVSLPIEIVK